MDLTRHLQSLALLFFILTTHLNLSHSRHHTGIRHKRQHNGNIYLPESFIIPGGSGADGDDWGPWGSPSECSRTCGGGVAYQTRECYNYGPDGQPSCGGGNKKYFSCNTQDCPDDEIDFRKQQCSTFDLMPFEGARYKWTPYTKAPNPCELNCMPVNERFYYRHKAKVIDGTRCNEESYNICVDGTCQPVGCDLMLGSEAREDKCRTCQGDGSSCRTIDGDLDMNNLQVGYNDMLLIPSGATNIEIFERAPSNNYLAIRNVTGFYYLNGYYKIDFPRALNFAGSAWHYERRTQGFAAPDKLTCMGPTTESVYLVLLSQDKNVGIHYEYSIPSKAAINPIPDTYFWSFTDFTPCSASCGGGTQSRNVTCNIRNSLEEVDNGLCDASSKPAEVQKCGTEACAPHWSDKPWSKCSKPCGSEGTQEREVKCQRVSVDGVAEEIEDSVCLNSVGNKPATVQSCNQDLICAQWHLGTWLPCNKLCGEGEQTRKVTCYRRENGKTTVLTDADCLDEKPEEKKKCLVKPCEGVDYVTSSWSGCSECGQTVETRTAICATKDGVKYDDKYCENRVKPELSRPCKAPACDFQWFSSQWSKCSAVCGKGVQSRKVVCGKFDGEFIKRADDESKCDESAKPENEKPCETAEDACPGQWFSGPWSECSKKCGDGEKTRKVLCIFNGTVSSAKNCDEEKIEFTTEKCNTFPCVDDDLLPVDVTSTPIMEDDEGEEYCDEDEDDIETEDSSLEDTGVTNAMTSADDLDLGSSVDMDSAGTTESSLLTDELMLSDSTYETAATDDSATMLPDTSSSDAEGSGSSPITLDSRFAEGSGDDAESAGTSDDSTVTSDGATDDVSVTSVAPGASDASPVSGDSSDATTIASAVSDDVVTLSSISASSSAAIVDTTTLMSVTDASEAASSELTTTEESTTPTETTPEATTETSEAITTTVDDMTTTNMPEMTTVEAGVATTEADAGATTIAPAEAAAPETDYDVPSRIGADDDTTASPVDVSTDSSVDASTVSSADSSTVASGSSEATVTDGSAATSDSSSDATDVTESSAKDSTESTVDMTTETDVEGTTVDIWTTTSDGSSSDTSDSDSTDMDGTTPNTLVSAIVKELTPRKCKPRPKIPVCIKSPFGCCADNFTAAKGPFDEGCPVAETCKDTKYGCCPDNVSPAAGHKNKGCPPPLCESSLFGCCSDKITPAEGEEKEGCPIEVTTVGGCAASKFGCCPDGVSEAKGKKNAGCAKDEVTTIKPTTAKSAEPEAKPDEKDCNNSLNGCCDDGVTAATGPNKAGCSTCASELFGCCPDRETPAHGPHGEGCCLSSPYGCCPDNMKEARGPQLEGCSCEYTTYGCCPDNKTTALSSSYEGCGCKYSPYGCCPDRVTEARGEKFEGCPCSAFQFGCCPDGETPAKGPQSQGCHCSQSEFKCCSDNVTPAKGPSMEGCTCATSQFGCCPDGHSEAKGKNFEECENVLESPQKACSLKRDMGSCNNFTVKHFYDAEYGGCSRFWYGGCEGNKNRFETIEECKSICEQPTGKDVCQLPKNSGPCKGYYPMYYYDNERNACTQFIYGGCLGNANRFETIEECKTSCAVDDSSVQCEQPRDEGPCAGSFERWYYNKQDDRCEPFHYGGCKGNKNNFASEGACKYSCQSPGAGKASCDLPSQTGGCDKKYARWFYSKDAKACAPFYFTGCDGNENNYRSLDECERECAPAVEKDMCFLPAEIGDCQNYVANWYYDTKEARCRQFYYGGCGGNGNNFPTEEACSKRCTEKAEVIPPSRPVAPVEAPPRFGTDEEPEDYCLGPKDAGNCEDYVERYYFDNRRKSCHAFTYTGCGGNHNNFASLAECSSSCAHLAEPETTHGPVRKPEPSADICILPEEPGNCSNYSIAFHYNSRDSTCSAFHYSGCGGNANNFNSMEQCERRCGEFKGIDVCQQEQDPGRCDQFSSRFAYNAATRRCVEFSYGGCEGNGNRFDTERECEEECQRAEEPAEPENAAICRLPAEAGECYDNNDEYIERWYYEPYYQTCVTFSYSGCTGNQNNFRSFESCSNFCMSKHEPEPARDNCYSFEQECRRLSCSYGLAKSYDPETNCEKCSCHYPCQDYGCPENHRCSIEMQKNPETGESEFVPFCSEIEKPGRCPHHLNNTECSVHCYTDADCRGNYKCCKAGCSSLCVPPIDDNAATQGPPVHVAGAQAPQLEEVPEEEVNVAHEEGGVAVLRCFATGYPPPSITWKRGGLILNTNQGRFILTSNGDLQIVQLHRTDSGTYVCVADNGVGLSVTRDVNLTVADPVEREAYIVGEANTTMIAKLNQPATLRCLAGGYPKPSVYWWRGSNLLPLSAENFEVNRDYSLVFNRLQLSDLGKYLCEAYTGKGKPITLTITLKTVGPVQPVSKEDEQYMKFVISPDEVPTTPRPAPPRRPVVIVPQIRDPIPLNTSVILPNGRVTYDVGGDLSLECAVSGYPIPKVVWFKDGRQLQESDRVQISDSNRLVVRELSTTDSGRYSCVAKNDYSEASDEKSIYVEGVYVPQNCTDNPFFANCKLIVQAQYCTHKYYAVFCCKSCTLAGQLNVGKK